MIRPVLLILCLILVTGTVAYLTIPKEADPDVAIRVGRSLGSLGTDAGRLAGILSICPVLMLKVLRAAKAEHPERVDIHSGKQAVELLGMEQTETLVINCVLRESLRTRSETVRAYLHGWWRRAMRVSAISEVLARMDKRFDPEYAALIGLLHNIAEPVLLGYADRHPDLADELRGLWAAVVIADVTGTQSKARWR